MGRHAPRPRSACRHHRRRGRGHHVRHPWPPVAVCRRCWCRRRRVHGVARRAGRCVHRGPDRPARSRPDVRRRTAEPRRPGAGHACDRRAHGADPQRRHVHGLWPDPDRARPDDVLHVSGGRCGRGRRSRPGAGDDVPGRCARAVFRRRGARARRRHGYLHGNRGRPPRHPARALGRCQPGRVRDHQPARIPVGPCRHRHAAHPRHVCGRWIAPGARHRAGRWAGGAVPIDRSVARPAAGRHRRGGHLLAAVPRGGPLDRRHPYRDPDAMGTRGWRAPRGAAAGRGAGAGPGSRRRARPGRCARAPGALGSGARPCDRARRGPGDLCVDAVRGCGRSVGAGVEPTIYRRQGRARGNVALRSGPMLHRGGVR